MKKDNFAISGMKFAIYHIGEIIFAAKLKFIYFGMICVNFLKFSARLQIGGCNLTGRRGIGRAYAVGSMEKQRA